MSEILQNLPKVVDKRRKVVGRGRGSNVGKTSRKGHKGQRARNRVRAGFEGGQSRFIQRLPFLRGVGFTGSKPTYHAEINVSDLDQIFADKAEVTVQELLERKIVRRGTKIVKILGRGQISKKLSFGTGFIFSDKAREKILSTGGSIPANTEESVEPTPENPQSKEKSE